MSGAVAATPGVFCDEAWTGAKQMQVIEQDSIDIQDLFSVGQRVAFRIVQHGRAAPDFGRGAGQGNVSLHAVGIVHVTDGAVTKGRIIRNRLDLGKRLGIHSSIAPASGI